MSVDKTESIRRAMVATINAERGPREVLEERHGQVWDTAQMQEDFEPIGFMAPFIVVRRRSDGKKGSLMFQGHPRYYFGFEPDNG